MKVVGIIPEQRREKPVVKMPEAKKAPAKKAPAKKAKK